MFTHFTGQKGKRKAQPNCFTVIPRRSLLLLRNIITLAIANDGQRKKRILNKTTNLSTFITQVRKQVAGQRSAAGNQDEEPIIIYEKLTSNGSNHRIKEERTDGSATPTPVPMEATIKMEGTTQQETPQLPPATPTRANSFNLPSPSYSPHTPAYSEASPSFTNYPPRCSTHSPAVTPTKITQSPTISTPNSAISKLATHYGSTRELSLPPTPFSPLSPKPPTMASLLSKTNNISYQTPSPPSTPTLNPESPTSTLTSPEAFQRRLDTYMLKMDNLHNLAIENYKLISDLMKEVPTQIRNRPPWLSAKTNKGVEEKKKKIKSLPEEESRKQGRKRSTQYQYLT